jgi:hypothetical protein
MEDILEECLEECLEPKYYKSKMFISPDPSQLPIPNFDTSRGCERNTFDTMEHSERNTFDIFCHKNLVLIVSDDEWSLKQLELLKFEDVLNKFEITHRPDWIDANIKGFPSVYNRTTDCVHLGYANYSSILSSLHEQEQKQILNKKLM